MNGTLIIYANSLYIYTKQCRYITNCSVLNCYELYIYLSIYIH